MENVVVLSGAGISAESGIKTFRDDNGLWEGHDVMEVASPQGWENNQELVLDFYNKRRRQLKTVQPNPAHEALVKLEEKYHVDIITQNVDDLHERAGSTRVIHLHGELLKARSTYHEDTVKEWKKDIVLGDVCENGFQMRPHIVWFGEAVPMMETAIDFMDIADAVFIVGTSMQVYPAASLIQYAHARVPIYFIDPKPSIDATDRVKVFSEKATVGVPLAIEAFQKDFL